MQIQGSMCNYSRMTAMSVRASRKMSIDYSGMDASTEKGSDAVGSSSDANLMTISDRQQQMVAYSPYRYGSITIEESIEISMISGETQTAKTKQDYFKELCDQFPDISFIVHNCTAEADGEMKGIYEYVGICDTSNFGSPTQKSFTVTEGMLERMADPVQKNRIFQTIEMYSKEYSSHVADLEPGMKCAFIGLFEDGNMYKYSINHASGEYFALKSYASGVDLDSSDFQDMIIRKAKEYADDMYDELVDSLFRDKDDEKKKQEENAA